VRLCLQQLKVRAPKCDQIKLVIDNCDRLSDEELWNLQEWAKDRADSGTLRVVFVGAEGRIPQKLRGSCCCFFPNDSLLPLVVCPFE
jgi:hypothetical protein